MNEKLHWAFADFSQFCRERKIVHFRIFSVKLLYQYFMIQC